MRLLSLAVLLAAAPVTAQTADPTLAAAVANPARTPANSARDRYRHPAGTLAFFGLRPTMTVVEVIPGGGYWTEILAPYLRADGRYYVAAPVDPAKGPAPSRTKLETRMKAAPAVFGKVTVTDWTPDASRPIAPAGTADMVLTFRNVHNWVGDNMAPAAFRAFYAALKPGGVLGLEEHRLPTSRADTPATADSGYMKEAAVIALAQSAGFRLAGRSEVNANPKDTADYPKGVWTLPPNYAEGDKERARYAAIGESDRMTLRFVKPN